MTRNFPSGLGNLLDIPQWRSILYDSVGAVEREWRSSRTIRCHSFVTNLAAQLY